MQEMLDADKHMFHSFIREVSANLCIPSLAGPKVWQCIGLRDNATFEEFGARRREILSMLHPDARKLDRFLTQQNLEVFGVDTQDLEKAVHHLLNEFRRGIETIMVDHLALTQLVWREHIQNKLPAEAMQFLFDPYRAHMPGLQWWLVAIGFHKLITDFASIDGVGHQPRPGQQVMSHVDAKKEWQEFYLGKQPLVRMFNEMPEGRKSIVMTCPEPSQYTNLCFRIIQENVLALLAMKKEFKLGILINIHRFPIIKSPGGKLVKDCYTGLQLYHNGLLDAHMWPIIHEVVVLDEMMMGQFSTAKNNYVRRNSFYAVVVFSSELKKGDEVISNMVAQKTFDSADHPNKIDWGQHKTDFVYLERQVKEHQDPRLPLWKYLQCHFPPTVLHQLPVPTLTMDNNDCGISMDIPMDYKEQTQTKAAIQEVVNHLADHASIKEFKDARNADMTINPLSRLSYASSKQECITAWDVTITSNAGTLTIEQEYHAAMALWDAFKDWNPIIGFKPMLNVDYSDASALRYVYMEFQWVQALQSLTTQNIIAWALLVASRHASVMFQNEYNFTADSLLDSIQNK